MSTGVRRKEKLPYRVRSIEHRWIPTRDGTRLSARIWLPEGAHRNPVPALLEFIPYRKRDMKRSRDTEIHQYFAGHGYASVRVDLRGSGDSEGILSDEYLPVEQQDGEDVLAWLAAQSWCTGRCGMIGISWGGFNALQIAARKPPQLRAVIAVAATDDRYADDVHYKGGSLLNDNLSWASTMFAYNSLPPDPQLVGDRWRTMWLARLRGSGLWVRTWMGHQRRNDYWRQGSVNEDYSAIACPVMVVSGWADGYPNPVFRMVRNMSAPCKGLVGPWSHLYPHQGTPGPRIGFLQEALRWWDRWLKDIETGVSEEPPLRVWMQESVGPRPQYTVRPGRWVTEPSWPSPHIKYERYPLRPGGIENLGTENGTPLESSAPEKTARPSPAPEPKAPIDHDQGTVLSIQSPLSVGLFGGKWCSYSNGPDLPHDQREEDGGSLVFDSDPLSERLEILGAPELTLDLSSDRPLAQIAVRLSDVSPEGRATRVTYGVLNLCHRDSHSEPKQLEPGRWYRVRVALDHIAQAFPPAHRIRISLSTSYWPLIWPPPEPVTLSIRPGKSCLTLPRRPPRPGEDEALRDLGRSEAAPSIEQTRLMPTHHNWFIQRDLANDESTLHVVNDEGRVRIEELDLEVQRRTDEWYRSVGNDFTSPVGEVRAERRLRRADWAVRTETYTRLTCTPSAFKIHATLDAYESGTRLYTENFNDTIARDHL